MDAANGFRNESSGVAPNCTQLSSKSMQLTLSFVAGGHETARASVRGRRERRIRYRAVSVSMVKAGSTPVLQGTARARGDGARQNGAGTPLTECCSGEARRGRLIFWLSVVPVVPCCVAALN